MKKKFMNLSAVAMLSASFILGGCDNAAENQKLMDADNSAVQTMVDAKMAELQAQSDADCVAQVQTVADSLYTEWLATSTKGKKVIKKVAAKPAAKKEEPKPETVGSGKPKMGATSDPNTVGSGKPKMGGATGSTGSNTIGNGKPKMGAPGPK